MRRLSLLALPLLTLACSHDHAATQPSVPPQPPTAEERVPLVAQLIVLPADIRIGNRPSTQPTHPVTLRMTLIVTNTTANRVYRGEAPTTSIARFALTSEGNPLWSGPQFAGQVVTPVAIAPGQRMTYHALVTLPDARPYVGRQLEAHAEFAPAHLTATTLIPVR